MQWNQVELYNVESMSPFEDGYLLSRVPEQTRLGLNENAQRNAYNGCGTEIRFRLLGDQATIRLRRIFHPTEPIGLAELHYGSYLASWKNTPCYIGKEPTAIVIERSERQDDLQQLYQRDGGQDRYDPFLIRLVLPYDAAVCLLDIEGDVAPPLPEQAPQRRYLAYGSSITHGGASVSPTETYAMQTARALGADLINLGFAGSAHLEPAIADYIASRKDWQIATLELGINMVGRFTVDQFRERVEAFLPRIVSAHPDKPIYAIDLFRFNMDATGNPKGAAFREIVANAVARLRPDYPRLRHLSGLDLLPSNQGLGSDLLHPSPLGMNMIAERLSAILAAEQ